MSDKKPGQKLEDVTSKLIICAVVGVSVALPAGLWIASKFFGWQMPQFIQDALKFFEA
jgi:hypothetical protein